jgi:NADH:ubiquinone reductase (non-electrogenic)
VKYDYLLVGIGSVPNTFNTPGVEQNCNFLKSIEGNQSLIDSKKKKQTNE